jgi:hypothetical protein
MNIAILNKRVHAITALVCAATGGLVSMGFLAVFHNWAFTTEFTGWATMTAVHSLLLSIFLTSWFWEVRPLSAPEKMIGKIVGAVILGGLVAVLIMWGLWLGILLVISGQAFITSAVAVAMYVAIASIYCERHRV